MAVAWNGAHTTAGHGSGSWTIPGHNTTGDTLLVAQVGDWVGPDVEAVTAMNFNGVALTLLGRAYNVGRPSLWYLVSPPQGTFTLNVTSSSTVAIVVTSYSGVDIASPFGTPVLSTGSSAPTVQPSSGAITAALTSLIIAHTGNLTDSLTPTAPAALLNRDSSGGFHSEAAYLAGTGSAASIAWTGYSTDNRWACFAVEIKAPTAAVRMLASAGAGK